jgi:regulator of protease activity HflC (stomatin/prohibitin superfamily)
MLFGLMSVSVSACMGCTSIGPGYAGIVVNQAGSTRGVQDYPVKTGWQFYNPITESVLEWPVFQQNVQWSKNPEQGNPTNEEITFNTKDKMSVASDVSMGYTLDLTFVPKFYVQFRTDDMKTWQDGFLHNLARQHFDDAAGRYDVEQIMGDSAPFLTDVRMALQKDLDQYGIHLNQFGFLASPRPPAPVLSAINASAQAKQTAITTQNEVASTTAEMQKEVIKANTYAANTLVKAKAEAEANREIAASITSTLVDYQRTQRWDGKLPTMTGSVIPMLNVK